MVFDILIHGGCCW